MTLSCSQPLTIREKGAGVGTAVGASVGAGIGSIWDYAGTGGLVGGSLGLITGALVGDHFEKMEKRRLELERNIRMCEIELQRLCGEFEKLKQAAEEE